MTKNYSIQWKWKFGNYSREKFPGDEIPIIRGSALKAGQGDTSEYGAPSIGKLMEALDSYIPMPKRETESCFLMAVEDALIKAVEL